LIPDPDPAFYAEYRSGFTDEKKNLIYFNFFDQKLQFFLPIPRPPKGFQATEEAFGPQKRTSITSKHEIS
jgi:hypothetical protein